MNIQIIVDRICSEARQDGEKLLAAAREQVRGIQERLEAQDAQKRAEILAQAHEESEKERLDMLRDAGREEDLLDLAMKREVMDGLIDLVIQAMMTLERERARDFIGRLLAETAARLTGEWEIVVRPEDAGLYDEEFLRQINEGLEQSRLSLSGARRDICGGFVLVQGDQEIDRNWDSVVREIWGGLQAEASFLLFSDAG